MSAQETWRADSRLLHIGSAPAGAPKAVTVAPPIRKGSTVLMPDAASLYDDDLITYGRNGLEAHEALIAGLAELESAHTVRLFPSGVAAITAAILAVVSAGDEVLVTDAVYKPTRRFCDGLLARMGVKTTYFQPDASVDAVEALCGDHTRLIVLESPASLSFEMQDVPAIAAMARRRGVLTLIDNTWAAGTLFKALDHGVDISAQSLTKYVGGHSDVFMGSAAARDPRIGALLHRQVVELGWAVSPEDAYMMLRGLRTLPTRLNRHEASALRVAQWLSSHPRVRKVLHPALPGAPGHALWKRDYSGASGVFSFVIDGPAGERPLALLDALRLFGLGFSWGGYESLALDCDPQFSSRTLPLAYGGPMVRLSVGLEDPDDLIADLNQALSRQFA